MKHNYNRIFLVLSLIILVNVGYGQYGLLLVSEEDYKQRTEAFLKSNETLYVVLTGHPSYDEHIKKAFNDAWTISTFKFISYDDCLTLKKSKEFYCLLPQTSYQDAYTYASVDYVGHPDKETKLSTYGWSILLREPPNGDYTIIAKTVSGFEVDRIYNYCEMLFVVQNLQWNIELHRKPSSSVDIDKKSIIGKTLVISSNDLNEKVNDGTKLKLVYPHKFKIVSDQELVEIMTEKSEDYVYGISTRDDYKLAGKNKRNKSNAARTNRYIIDAQTGKFLYSSWVSGSTGRFKAKHFKEILKQ